MANKLETKLHYRRRVQMLQHNHIYIPKPPGHQLASMSLGLGFMV